MLNQKVEFLKEGLRERNLSITIFNFRNASDESLADAELIEESKITSAELTDIINNNSQIPSIPIKIVDHEEYSRILKYHR